MLKKCVFGITLLCAVLFVQWQKPAKQNVAGLKRLVYEKFSFYYDTSGKMDSSGVNTFSILLGKKQARMEPKNKQLVKGMYDEVCIVKRVNSRTAEKITLFEGPKGRQALKKTIDVRCMNTGCAGFTMVEHPGVCKVNNMMCRKIEMRGNTHQYMYYITRELDVNDGSGSNFLIPYRMELLSGFDQLRPKLKGGFIMRADVLNKKNQVIETVRLKGMDEGVKDTGYFKIPANYTIFTNDSMVLQYHQVASGFKPYRGNGFRKRIPDSSLSIH
ncbi:MAG TPA: hypothetical protein VK177_20045 [Flavobacteriales bacterium]|nr:hypothetical protein [Flavobacteriales bacterium]